MSLAKRCFVKAKTIIGCNLLKIATDDCFYKSKIDRPQSYYGAGLILVYF